MLLKHVYINSRALYGNIWAEIMLQGTKECFWGVISVQSSLKGQVEHLTPKDAYSPPHLVTEPVQWQKPCAQVNLMSSKRKLKTYQKW